MWQSFSQQGCYKEASVRKCQKLPLCSTELIPASCRMDPTLTKPKPISDDGGTSEIKFLRRRGRGQRERFERNSPADPKVSEEGEEGSALGPRTEISPVPSGRHPCWSSSWTTAACGKSPHWTSLWRTVSPFKGEEPLARAAKEREEGVAETSWTDCSSYSLSPCITGGRR